jgi:rhodanese-related sulfurtransferase
VKRVATALAILGIAALAILAGPRVPVPVSAMEVPEVPVEVVRAVQNMARNLPSDMFQMSPAALAQRLQAGQELFLLDVRRPDEFAAGRIEGAVNVPVHEIAEDLHLLPEDPETFIVVYCRSGVRSMFATAALLMLGYKTVYNMQGGIIAWEAAGFSVVR